MAVELLTADRIRVLLAVSQTRSFSEAADKLGISPSAVSRQVLRIEQDTGCRIFVRDPAGPVLTQDGEALLLFAKAMAEISESAKRYFTHARPKGLLRFGVTEDMARSCLTSVLALFADRFPAFAFQITCDLSARLAEGLDDGTLDMVLVNHLASERQGELLRTLPLAWFGRADAASPLPDPLPLVLTLAPDAKRMAALGALRDAGRSWRVVFESASLSAVEAGLEAGVGIAVLGAGTERHGMVDLGRRADLPPLPDQAFSIDWRSREQVSTKEIEAFVDVVRRVVREIRDPRDRREAPPAIHDAS